MEWEDKFKGNLMCLLYPIKATYKVVLNSLTQKKKN